MSERTHNKIPALAAASVLGGKKFIVGISFLSVCLQSFLAYGEPCRNNKPLDELKTQTTAFLSAIKGTLISESGEFRPVGMGGSNSPAQPTQFYAVDRKVKELIPLNSVGVVRLNTTEAKSSYGSGFLIDGCYILTNRHVAKKMATKDKTGSPEPILGQEQIFSVGQKCEPNQFFQYPKLKATLIDMGGSNDQNSNQDLEDWALLALDQHIPDIPTPEIFEDTLIPGTPIYPVGYAEVEMQDALSYSAVRVEKTKIKRIRGNIIERELGTKSTQGLSGGPVFVAVKKTDGSVSMKLVGISSTSGGIITIKHILNRFRRSTEGTMGKIEAGPDSNGRCRK
jgi:hypothetical protein